MFDKLASRTIIKEIFVDSLTLYRSTPHTVASKTPSESI